MKILVMLAVFFLPPIVLLASGYAEPFPAAVPVGWGALAGEGWAALMVWALATASRST